MACKAKLGFVFAGRRASSSVERKGRKKSKCKGRKFSCLDTRTMEKLPSDSFHCIYDIGIKVIS